MPYWTVQWWRISPRSERKSDSAKHTIINLLTWWRLPIGCSWGWSLACCRDVRQVSPCNETLGADSVAFCSGLLFLVCATQKGNVYASITPDRPCTPGQNKAFFFTNRSLGTWVDNRSLTLTSSNTFWEELKCQLQARAFHPIPGWMSLLVTEFLDVLF